MAEREGFEPSIRFCRILTFQASAFDHSATAPHIAGRRHLGAAAEAGKLAADAALPLWRLPMRSFGAPPSAEDIEAIARGAVERLPKPFSDSIGDIVLLVEEFADDATLHSLGIEDPFDLSGLYEGIPLTERSVDQSGTMPERIFLYRRPILDEWAGGEETLEHLVTHVLIHELGHHFGLSDDDIHLLEEQSA